jgi:hypothetical protein
MEVANELAAKEENSRQLRSTELASWRESAAWLLLCTMLVSAGLYILANYLRALAWALVLAVALWPFYDRVGIVICGRPRLARVFYERLCKTVGCSHMSGLCARLLWPLALMISAD